MATAIYYQGSEISNIIDGSEKVLKTSNVWVSDDIGIKYSTNINSILPSLIDRTISSIPSNVSATVTSIGNYAFAYCTLLTTASFPNVTSIGSYAFYSCAALTTASFPNATRIWDYAFSGCGALTTASFPSVTIIGIGAFYSCAALTTASFPNATRIANYAFRYCSALTTASFPNVTSIGNSAFYSCRKLSSLYLMGSSVVSLGNAVFTNTPMSLSTYLGYFGSIYVPASLLTAYQAATNWSVYSSRFVSV